MPMDDEIKVLKTGGKVDSFVEGLIKNADDKNELVQQAISESLHSLGNKHVELVLSSCLHFLVVNMRDLSTDHRVAILQVMEKIVLDNIDLIDDNIAHHVVKQAVSEMTSCKEVVPVWQTAASNLLVAAGHKFTNKVMAELTQHFQPGVLPHFFVVQTLGKLAVASAFNMVPFINVALGTMLPMLGMAKQENLRWVFSYTLAKFAESIVYYVENLDQAPDPNVKVEVFSDAFYSVYEMLYNVWLPQAKDSKLRVGIIRALGNVSHVISKAKLTEQLPKLIPGILSLYKKHSSSLDHLAITESFCMILDSATQIDSLNLETLWEPITNQLHSFICQPVDFSNNDQVKNQNELLRCFAMLNRTYSDKVVANLLHKLEQKEERIRIGALFILRHLINTGGHHMDIKKALIISGLKLLTQEPSLKVRKVFVQTIIAMAHHGYLELEGGEMMIEFIVRQCTLQDASVPTKKPADPDYTSPQALRSMCESVLHLVVTTVEIMEKVLWPFLLEFIIPNTYTEAFGVVCKNLSSLAGRKRERNDADYLIDYEDEANLPNARQLIARFFVMSGIPENGGQRGCHVLNAMASLAPNLHEDIVGVWSEVIPKMQVKLEEYESQDEFPQKNWNDLILHLLSKSLDCVDDEDWTIELGKAFVEQLQLYKEYSEEKGFCLKCLGVVMKKATKKEFIQSCMQAMFAAVDHRKEIEQQGLAAGLGFASAAHFDSVLTKLEQAIKLDGGKKTSSLISFIKEKVNTSENADNLLLKQTVMMSYGYVTLYAPVSLVTSRVDAVIVRNITPHFSNQKDPILKKYLINTIELIAKSLDPLHLHRKHPFSDRTQFLDYLMTCVKNESTEKLTGKIRICVFSACAALVKLEPLLSEADSHNVLHTCITSVLSLPESTAKGKSETYEQQVMQQQLLNSTVQSLNSLLEEFLLTNFSPTNLQTIVKHILPWVSSEKDNEREKAVSVLHFLVKYYLDHMDMSNKSEDMVVLGEVVGKLIPRCTDPTISVRNEAIMAIQAMLRIHLVYTDIPVDTADKMVDALPILKERLQKSDASVLFNAVNDLAKVIAKKFPTGAQLTSLVDALIEGLADSQALCSNGACVVLNGVVKLRGAEFSHQVDDLLAKLHARLYYIKYEQTRTGALRCVKFLSDHHLDTLMQCLLSYSLPYDESVVEFWKILAKNPSSADRVIETFLEMLKQSMPYEEKTSSADKKTSEKVATLQPLSIVMALKYMLEVPEVKETVGKYYHHLFGALVLKVGSYHEVRLPTLAEPPTRKISTDKKSKTPSKPKPGKAVNIVPSVLCVETLKTFFEIADNENICRVLEEQKVWIKLQSTSDYVCGIESLASCLAMHNPSQITNIISSLRSFLSTLYDTDRIVVAALFGQLIKDKCGGDLTLVDTLVGSLMGRLVDSCLEVRRLCVRGLGNIGDTGTEMVQKYSTTILSAMMSGMDDRDDIDNLVTTEAMSGLSKILLSINESHIRPILINIALKIRPCFEKSESSVRAAAFKLFGNLAKFGNGPSAMPFLEQIISNLTSILLHLNDHETGVVLACKHTLRLVGPLLNSEGTNGMFQKYMIDSAQLHYGEFINDLCKSLVIDFKEHIPNFITSNITAFKSPWPEIRSNAAIFLGFLMNALPDSAHSLVNHGHISSALLALLGDPDFKVRSKAAEAMSLLSNY